jgi:hypothetical protein
MTGRRIERALAADAEHVTIYYEKHEFCGWPFNHGVWRFSGDELLISFSRGRCAYESPAELRHAVVDGERGEYVTLRSFDGGRTWPRDTLDVLGTRSEFSQRVLSGAAPLPPATPDWTAPDFCMTAGFGLPPEEAQDAGYVQYSMDRGRTWWGPYRPPALGFSWVQVKPDYLVRPDGMVLLFVTVRRPLTGGAQPATRFVAVYASPDNGTTWRFLSSIVASSPDVAFVNRYYASPVQLPGGRIVAALRCQIDAQNAWPEVFCSDDGGRTWRFLSRPSDWGGPTHLSQLADGRLLAVYGYRVPPFGVRARTSSDGGETWGEEIILRDDGGSSDLGYPKAVQLSDGRVLAAYYFNRADDETQMEGGVRHIAGTYFRP